MHPPGENGRLLESPAFNKFLILVAAATWGLSFIVMKDLVNQVPVFWLLAVRYTLASCVMVAVAWPRLRVAVHNQRTLRLGLLLGMLNYSAYAVQTLGLSMTTPGKNSFFTGCYCVLTPFTVWAVTQKRPTVRHVLAGVICVAGIGLIALDGDVGLNAGDVLTLVSALCYALQYACLARWGEGSDILVVTTIEFIVMAVISTCVTMIFERGFVPGSPTLASVGSMAFLVLICSCFNFWAINHGLTYVDTTEGGILSALEAPFGVAASVLLYGEQLTPRLLVGFALIFAAIITSET